MRMRTQTYIFVFLILFACLKVVVLVLPAMAQTVKGTATSLASMFPVEEAEKAAQLVHDSISDTQKQLDHLNRFITENTDLVNLVHRLPDELSHQIMVPFGKAAFFPGRLIHTNEFMVLLGDGYYAERTSKQTTEILQRRGRVLESQVDSLKATILDLQAEASFFYATAAEAAEGLIEIREDYIEEFPTERSPNHAGLSKSNSLDSYEENEVKVATEDDEYAKVMSRLDELEREEFGAQSDSEDDEDEDVEARLGSSLSQTFINDQGLEKSGKHQLEDPIQKLKDAKLFNTTTGHYSQQDHTDLSTINSPDSLLSEDLKVQDMAEDEPLHGKNLVHRMDKSNTGEKPLLVSESVRRVDRVSTPNYEGPYGATASYSSQKGSDRRTAFTGSIVEHCHNIPSNSIGQSSASSQAPASKPSKPVSRFKMQKAGHDPGY